MRVLVTRGAGFVSSHLCDALLAEGNEVLCVDNFLTGNRDNIAHLSHESRFELLEQDVCRAFDSGHVDYVFRFAAAPHPDFSDPQESGYGERARIGVQEWQKCVWWKLGAVQPWH